VVGDKPKIKLYENLMPMPKKFQQVPVEKEVRDAMENWATSDQRENEQMRNIMKDWCKSKSRLVK
jgi:hypothetical protein